VTDRPTESHEYILMLTKSARYYWNQDAVREPANPETQRSKPVNPTEPPDNTRGWRTDIEKGRHVVYNRNLRSVWEIATQPYPEAHFATFPEELPKKCIMAATPPMCCAKCGAPYETITERKPMEIRRTNRGELSGNRTATSGTMISPPESKVLGYKPSCSCNAGTSQSVVLDPFGGSGTTGKVAKELNRKAVLVDLSVEYCKLAVKRVSQVPIPMELNV